MVFFGYVPGRLNPVERRRVRPGSLFHACTESVRQSGQRRVWIVAPSVLDVRGDATAIPVDVRQHSALVEKELWWRTANRSEERFYVFYKLL